MDLKSFAINKIAGWKLPLIVGAAGLGAGAAAGSAATKAADKKREERLEKDKYVAKRFYWLGRKADE